jgi:hypothetical protein
MALIVFIMSILSEIFVAGLESFRQLKGIGDLQEDLRNAALELRSDVLSARFQAEDFIGEGLRTGSADPVAAVNLRSLYQGICVDAASLGDRLRTVERQTTNPVARRLLRRSLDALALVKQSASLLVELLGLFDPPSPASNW